MTFDWLNSIVIAANQQGWLRNAEMRTSTLKSDLAVTVRERDCGILNHERFEEPWAFSLGRDLPSVYVFDLWYGASFVKEFRFACVDGGRALLPFPAKRDDLRITSLQLAIALAVNDNDGFRDYLTRAGIQVQDELQIA